MDINEYLQAVQSCAINKTNYLFHNEGPEHARIILSNIFMNAQESICMASNRLTNTEIVNTDEYKNALLKFLNKSDSHLKIILTHVPDEVRVTEPNSLFAMLYYHPAYRQNRISIHDGKGRSFIDKEGNLVNFCVGDGIMYRMETDIEHWRAVANFGDTSFSNKLAEKFKIVFEKLPEFKLDSFFETNGTN